ncbi:helix-turn-helix transcriptional regulator [Micromonospora sp. WMMA1363]|uniref:helix-turn-helix domain-containing protein n=1 Tax=Micromonospora sp. WMMA1363 TaxID=3053985 RepID=UPI00259CF197|nr:helix-turn-helix transcriptional regulator [Micromonospora sp. WMMA1363]MDM4721853.1 helix-turn-helix transcriptional regulator [Micromonospora sp. WMMA1363]
MIFKVWKGVESVGTSPSGYLLNELRRRRTAAGLTQAQLGEKLFLSDSLVSAIETGSKAPSREYLDNVDRALGLDAHFVTMWDELVKGEATPVWLREWLAVEAEATLLRWYEPAYVPGILQTEAYARATLSSGLLPPDEIEERVTSRVERQSVLTGSTPKPLVAVLDVMVLRRQIAGHPGIMADQLQHLAKVATLPHVQILVVPEDAGVYPGLQGGFILASMDDGSVIAYLDQQVRAQVVNGAHDLATLQRTWEVVRGEALSRRQSLELITEAAQTWR